MQHNRRLQQPGMHGTLHVLPVITTAKKTMG